MLMNIIAFFLIYLHPFFRPALYPALYNCLYSFLKYFVEIFCRKETEILTQSKKYEVQFILKTWCYWYSCLKYYLVTQASDESDNKAEFSFRFIRLLLAVAFKHKTQFLK